MLPRLPAGKFPLPLACEGVVVRGKGRGSKQLGCPTANLPDDVVEKLPKDLPAGVYFGWARVDDGETMKMVANVGWCPFYGNERKSLEAHILHEFPDDFYGSRLRLCLTGYLRPERNFASLEGLIAAIRDDVTNGGKALDDPSFAAHKRLLCDNDQIVNSQ